MIYTIIQRAGIKSYPFYKDVIKKECQDEEKNIILNHLPDADIFIVPKINAIIGSTKEKIIGSLLLILTLLSRKIQQYVRSGISSHRFV
jgi:hypothetical protein